MLMQSGSIDISGEHAFGPFAREGDNVVDISGNVTSRQAATVWLGGTWILETNTVGQTDATGNRLLLHGSPQFVGDIVNDGAFFAARRFVGVLPAPESVPADTSTSWTLHAAVFPLSAHRPATDGITGYDIDGSGIEAGVDRRWGDLLLGGAVTYQHLWIEHIDSTSRSDVNVMLGVLRASWDRDNGYLRGQIGYGRLADDSRREILAPSLARQAQSSSQTNLLFSSIEGGRRIETQDLSVTPFVGFDYAAVFWGGFTEHGADLLIVNIKSTTTENLRSVTGVVIATPVNVSEKYRLNTRLRLAWNHEFADAVTTYQASLAGETFDVRGRNPGRNSFSAGFDLQMDLGNHFSATVGFTYERQRDDYAQAAKAGFVYAY